MKKILCTFWICLLVLLIVGLAIASRVEALSFTPNPKLELTKVCDTETTQVCGEDVSFTVTAENTGDVTLTNVQLTDPTLSLNCSKPQPFILLPGEVVTCTGTDTCTRSGPLTNTVSATADWDLGSIRPIVASAACTCNCDPHLAVLKTCTPPQQMFGNDITYSVKVQNDGNIKLTVTEVIDPTIPGLVCNVSLPNELAPGYFFTCSGTDTCEYSGSLRNDVIVNAQFLDGQTVVPLAPVTAFTEDCVCNGPEPQLYVKKTCDPSMQMFGNDITFTVTVQNTGGLGFYNVQLIDPTMELTCSKTPPFSLAAAEVVTCTGKDTCEQLGPLCNTVTAIADSFLGPGTVTTETCECICEGPDPQIQVKKTCTPPGQSTLLGDDIDYTVEIKNIGGLDLTVTNISDPTIPGLACPATPFTITPGQVVTCTGTDTCESPGPLRNDVTVQAVSLLGPLPPATAYTNECICKEQPNACRLTAGGVKFEPLIGKRMATANSGNSGPVISIGGNVNPACSPTAGDGGIWTHIDHKAKLFFQGRQIEVVDCGNIPGLPPGSTSPDTQFNYIEFKGTGTLKGISGNKVDYGTVNFYARVEDRSEPGSKQTTDPFIDQYWIRITDAMGAVLYELGNDVPNPEAGDTIPISGGNMQIQAGSCDSYY